MTHPKPPGSGLKAALTLTKAKGKMMKTESKQDLRDKVDMLEEEVESLEEKVAYFESKVEELVERNEGMMKSLESQADFIREKRYVAKDGWDLLDKICMEDFALMFSHFDRHIYFSAQGNKGRWMNFKLDDSYEVSSEGGELNLYLKPNSIYEGLFEVLDREEKDGED